VSVLDHIIKDSVKPNLVKNIDDKKLPNPSISWWGV